MTLTNGNIKLQTRSPCLSLRPALAAALLPLLLLLQEPVFADVSRIEIHERELLDTQDSAVQYEAITGLLHFTLDPQAAGNRKIVDLTLAPTNAQGLVEYSTDFRLLVPRDGPLGDTLLYQASTNTFAVVDRDGVPRTMFKPTTGAAYWAEQKERAPTFGQRRNAEG